MACAITNLSWELDRAGLGKPAVLIGTTSLTQAVVNSHTENLAQGLQIILKETTGKLTLARCRYFCHNIILLAEAKYILTLKNAQKSCSNYKKEQQLSLSFSKVGTVSPSQ